MAMYVSENFIEASREKVKQSLRGRWPEGADEADQAISPGELSILPDAWCASKPH
jgi:hypothetical protein